MQSKYYKRIVKRLTKKEGKKSQVSRGNVMELLGIIADMNWGDSRFATWLLRYGDRRSRKTVVSCDRN